ncbi:nuclear factor of activated T-cells, cytoplasmic 4-like [Heptranchias perlo]|uniref:nuclear factor of activated T-cells, cytoplasmic 4-like n=1 Tax=Heptranchias perlo TaxID=212740 RepID=UPI00355A6C4F
MFIGTADDRNLRPHAFYQVHRITGKMVATSSQEAVVSTTKVLEVSLLPENNMTASIDCAGILKLRNSDIELRKGETDIGRKNTRVKLVFRVHVPQPNGKVVSLQVASVPIECSQRSAHELPQVESYNVNSSPVTGGDELLLTGCNFLPESKVVFIEKGPDGRPQWEVDAKINSVRSTETLIVAEVPPYRNQSLTRAAQVCFLVCNGKRKRSPCQCFQYLPVLIKEEPYEGFEVEPDSPLRSPLEYPPSVPTAGLCQPPSTLSDPGVFAPASPSVPLPSNPGCPAPKAFGDACPHPSPVPGLPAFLLDAEWNEACKQVPPGFGCCLTPPNHGHPLTPPKHGHPLTPPNHGHPLTPPKHGHPLTPPNHGHPMTPPNQGDPLTPPSHGHPLTPPNHGHPLTPPNHGHPLTPPNQGHHLTPTNQGHPLTPPKQGHPLTSLNQGHHLTPTNQGHPLTPLNEGQPLTPLNQGQPLTPTNQGHPLTPTNHGHPLNPTNHGHPLAPPNQGHPLTPLNQGHPLTHLPLGPSCSYSPPDWPSGADLHLPVPPAGPFYPTPSQALGHCSPPAQSLGNGLGPPPPLAPPRGRALYPPELPAAHAPSSCRLAPHRPSFPSGSVPTSGVFQDTGQAEADTAAAPPESSPSRQHRPFLEQPPPPPARGQDQGGGEATAPPETPAVDAKGETMECDLTFSTIPIQGITLDDVNEIIGRDLTEVPESLRADGAMDNP